MDRAKIGDFFISSSHGLAIWILSALTIAAILIRPFKWPEWPWAIAGGLLLIVFGWVGAGDAVKALGDGVDVYLFLLGMMTISELAREEGVFDWLAEVISHHADGSSAKLFSLIYVVGILVTVFMSNDATAVVLTPAVYQIVRKAGAQPKPYLFACALIANAASFVLPISNPANLVVYGKDLPGLAEWLRLFVLPSLISIVCTYAVLVLWFRRDLRTKLKSNQNSKCPLPGGGKLVCAGLILTVAVLLTCSALKKDLGAPTFLAAAIVLALVSWRHRRWPNKVLSNLSWGVIPLVGGLFVIVAALQKTPLSGSIHDFFKMASQLPPIFGKQLSALAVAVVSNLANNLPVGLLAGMEVQAAGISPLVKQSVLIGVDLGPNLSVTGSLATILWLAAIRREGEHISGWDFFKLGLVVMPISLMGALLLT